MEIKRKYAIGILALLLVVLSVSTFSGLQILESSTTWVHVGVDTDPSQMTSVRTEFNPGIPSTKKYTGPQTAQAIIHAFDETYNRRHAHTIVTLFSEPTIANIKHSGITKIDTLRKLLRKEGISSQFTTTEIDTQYPRHLWIHNLLERGITIHKLSHYFFWMAHRYQLAFIKDNPHLWKIGVPGISNTEAWEIYYDTHIDKLVEYYTVWKRSENMSRKRIEITRNRIKAWFKSFNDILR